MRERSCPGCGRRWRRDVRFCGACGAALEPVGTPRRTPHRPWGGAAAAALVVAVGVWLLGSLAPGRDAEPGPPASERESPPPVVLARPGAVPQRPAAGTPVWRRDLAAGGAVSADATTLYVGTDDGAVAIDRATGDVVWRTPRVRGSALDPLPSGVPFVDAGGALQVLDPADGTVRWEHTALREDQPGAVSAGVFLVVVADDAISSHNASGREFWRVDVLDAGWVGVGGGGLGLIFVTTPSSVLALHPLTGAVAWSSPVDDTRGPVHASGGVVLVADEHSRLHGLDARNGEKLWSAPTGDHFLPTADGAVAIVEPGPTGGRVAFVDAATGGARRTTEVATAPTGLARVGSDVVVIDQGGVTALAPPGTVRWRLETDAPARSVLPSGDHLILVTDDEVLAVVAPRADQRGTRS